MQLNRRKERLRCAIMTCFGIALWGFAVLSSAETGSEKLDFQCVTNFNTAVVSNANLEISQVDVVKLADGTEYLLAVGITPNKAKSEPSAKAILDTHTVSAAKARKQAATFLKSEVKSMESVQETKVTEKTTTDTGVTRREDRLTRIREEYVVEEAEAILPQSKIVATWFNEDRSMFNSVLAVPLKRK